MNQNINTKHEIRKQSLNAPVWQNSVKCDIYEQDSRFIVELAVTMRHIPNYQSGVCIDIIMPLTITMVGWISFRIDY